MGTAKAENGKCPDGYTHVFGPLCVEKSMLEPLEDLIPDLPDIQQFTNAPCESALAALKEVQESLQAALKLPKQLVGAVKGLLEYPFNIAEQLAAQALGALDDISAAIDELLSPLGVLSDAADALEKALDCPLVADSELGKTIAGVVSALRSGLPIDGMIDKLKGQLSNAVSDQLNALKKTPVEALNNMEKMFNDILQRSGVGEIAKQLKGLEACVGSLCDLAEIAERLPTSADDMLSGINGRINAATGKLEAAVMRPVNAAQETAKNVSDAYKRAKAVVVTTQSAKA